MRAARMFAHALSQSGRLERTRRIRTELFGSLAYTGKGHGTDNAVLLGLQGETPETVDPERTVERVSAIRHRRAICVLGRHETPWHEQDDLIFDRKRTMPVHSNAVRFTALDESGTPLDTRLYYSIGGGFVITEDTEAEPRLEQDRTAVPYPLTSGDEILSIARRTGLSLSSIVRDNETVWRTATQIDDGLDRIWHTMRDCVQRGCERSEPILPGKLQVRRRAPALYQRLKADTGGPDGDPLTVLDWVNLYALAVNEENATGGRVVTAPTNGAAGIIPAVLHYYRNSCRDASDQGVRDFLLAAGGIGILYKENASISGAEAGCQGEVGVACSMAAGALTEVMGGTVLQVEQAAEIGMEHNLGLTCDPVGGLVQIPCIERNAMGAVKAINAARMALRGDGTHRVSLDKVIKTMRQTGADMKKKYKETARGGLAVNVIEC